jgi:hypothetical protein
MNMNNTAQRDSNRPEPMPVNKKPSIPPPPFPPFTPFRTQRRFEVEVGPDGTVKIRQNTPW